VEKGVSRAVERERKGGGGEKGTTAALGGLYARAERQREKNWGPSSMHVQVEEKREVMGGGVRREGRLAYKDPGTAVAGGRWHRRTTQVRAHGQGRQLGGAPAQSRGARFKQV
jgi:hypothetical protein